MKITVQLIRAFVFATLIVQTLFFLNLKFQVSSHLLWSTAQFLSDLVGNPVDRFFRIAAHINKSVPLHVIMHLVETWIGITEKRGIASETLTYIRE